jgi:sugar O-acyltransferase (sialic acid O-acetyltransferase NeuD family)
VSGRALHILGAGGHAKVAAEAWQSSGGRLEAFHDDDPARWGQRLLGHSIHGGLADAVAAGGLLHIAIGNNEVRRRIAGGLSDDRFPAVVHGASILSPTALLAAGALLCAGAVVQAEARIGRHVIVNTSAVVEHDVVVEDFAHIAPGVRLAGGVHVGEGALIGVGAIVLPGITVESAAIVGAGAVVLADVPAGTTVVGVPARIVGGRRPTSTD